MGNKISKSARKLPSKNLVQASVNAKQNSPNKIRLQNPDAPRSHEDDLEQLKSKQAHISTENKNVNKIRQLKVEEIPIELDQNVSIFALFNKLIDSDLLEFRILP